MSNAKGIQIRRVSITRQEDMPTFGIAQSVGGTMYGTTPGGTRIIYDRLFLLKQKESPAARTPPSLPQIPGVTRDLDQVESPTSKPRKCSVINEGEEEQTSNDSNKQPTCSTSTAGNDQIVEEEDDLLEEEDDVGMEM